MIRHIVWWTLKPDCVNQAEAIQTASSSLKSLPSVRSVDVSIRILAGSTVPCQVILVSTHDGEQALEEYKKDPVHVKFAQMITAAAQSRSCIDYELM
ncbi:MAG: Dabb family protein [Desulfovibrio sp.]|nr:Dabb family protein [Desulfovibrio sp.]